jgi:hypothetical protein
LLTLAAGLFAFIFFFERHLKKPESGPPKVFASLDPKEIDNIQIQPKGQRAIHVVRTNSTWHMDEPLDYPAEAIRVEALLEAMSNLRASTYLSPLELKNIAEPEAQFGFDTPQFSLMLNKKKYLVLVGNRTVAGDQAYLQVVGTEGVFIVDADILKLIPRAANDWRNIALANWADVKFDRLVVTNAGKTLELHLTTNRVWRMVQPMDTRVDWGKVDSGLKQLVQLRVQQFVSDEPKPDLESFGLQPAELSFAFVRGTNTVLQLDFGKGPTNNANVVYARCNEGNTIVTVQKTNCEAWLFSRTHEFRDFLDPRVMALTTPPESLEVHALDTFTLEHDAHNSWRVQPQNYPADSNLVMQVFFNLTNLQITAEQIVKDTVPTAELPDYGLAQPLRKYILKRAEPEPGSTNVILAQLDFGTNQNKLYARVPGEGFVYAMSPATFDLFPSAAWQMRDRRVWSFSESDVASATIQQGRKTRELLRKGDKNWTLGTNSQGILDEIVSAQIDETIHRLGDLSANFWVQQGDQNLDAFGFKEEDFRVTVELKNGEKRSVQFGKDAPSKFPYAAVVLDGSTWVMEFPWTTYQFVDMYLRIPANVP